MMVFIITLILLVCILLILVVLAQDSKGGGLTGNVGSASQVIGVRKTTDWIEKLTWGLGLSIFLLALIANTVIETGPTGGLTSPNIERAKSESPAAPGMELPTDGSDANVDELIQDVEGDSVQ